MKPLVLAAGFAALGTVDLAFIDLSLVPALLSSAPAAVAVAPPPPRPAPASTTSQPSQPAQERPAGTTVAVTQPHIRPSGATATALSKEEPAAVAAPTPPVPPQAESRAAAGSSAPTQIILHFDVNARTPSGDIAPELKTVAELLGNDATLHVIVDGHSDRNGSAAYNDELSRVRATATVEALTLLGVDRSRISSAAHGARVPIAKGRDADSLARNRRVEVRVERGKP